MDTPNQTTRRSGGQWPDPVDAGITPTQQGARLVDVPSHRCTAGIAPRGRGGPSTDATRQPSLTGDIPGARMELFAEEAA